MSITSSAARKFNFSFISEVAWQFDFGQALSPVVFGSQFNFFLVLYAIC